MKSNRRVAQVGVAILCLSLGLVAEDLYAAWGEWCDHVVPGPACPGFCNTGSGTCSWKGAGVNPLPDTCKTDAWFSSSCNDGVPGSAGPGGPCPGGFWMLPDNTTPCGCPLPAGACT